MLIKNVYIVDPYTKEEGRKDILIQEGKIVKVSDADTIETKAKAYILDKPN